jgi:solute carrier family 25 (mitochondrial 2-oxodicarboxylate transporter), member 21
MASITNIPWDVAKTRIQSSSKTNSKYKTCIQTILLINKEEGFKALYKGLIPKLMRLGPGNLKLNKQYLNINNN